MKKTTKKTKAASSPQNDIKLTDTAVGKCEAQGDGCTSRSVARQEDGGVRCSALLGDVLAIDAFKKITIIQGGNAMSFEAKPYLKDIIKSLSER